MTDIASYLNLLFATIGEPHCPRTGEPTPSRSASQILEAILSLPDGTEVELRAPVFKVYGEELDFVFTEVRKKGCRTLIIDGKRVDISEEVELDEAKVTHMDAIVDRVHRRAASTRRRSRRRSPATLLVGDGLLQVQVVQRRERRRKPSGSTRRWQPDAPLRLRRHRARRTSCSTIPRAPAARAAASASHKLTHPELLVPDPTAQHSRRLLRARRRSSTTPTPGTAG